jgi:ribonuclease P protein subunit POP4
VYRLPKEECKYEIFQGLNRMWVQYMLEILDLGPGGGGWRVQQQQQQKQEKGEKQQENQQKNRTLVSALAHGSKLVSADFHGAEVEVVRSRCSGRVGLKGIVVRDTKFTFVIVTPKDEVKSEYLAVIHGWSEFETNKLQLDIPKEQTIFRFCVPLPDSKGAEEKESTENGAEGMENSKKLVFELHGSQFQNRPADRVNKKFKWRNVEYL